MEKGKWQREKGRWKMAEGRWKMENGKGIQALLTFKTCNIWTNNGLKKTEIKLLANRFAKSLVNSLKQ